MIGETLAHYKILEQLGAGGMGEVYLAQDCKLERRVALKVLPPDLASSDERLERFEREAKALAALDHPNIVHIYSVESAVIQLPAASSQPPAADSRQPAAGSRLGGRVVHFMTMQLVEGKPLSEVIPEGGLGLDHFLEISAQLADALAAAHDKGVTHRDLKPANVMVTDAGEVKVLDFGLAKLQRQEADLGATQRPTELMTQEGMIVGTVPYMAPEQVQGKVADGRSDIFSLGVIFYEMATGVRPFGGDTAADLISSILRDTPSTVSELQPELPPELGRLVSRCLEKDPRQRYQSSLDLHNELRELTAELASAELTASSTRAAASARSIRWLIPALGAMVIMLLLVMALVLRDRWVRPGTGAPTEQVTSAGAAVEVKLVSKRILVVPFDNRTGDPSLDSVGLMAADWITQGLAHTELVQAVPSMTALSADRYVDDEKGNLEPLDRVRLLAEGTAAGTVVTGALYRQGDELLFSAEVSDAVAATLVQSLQPVRAPLDDPLSAVEELRERVTAAVAAHLDPRLASLGRQGGLPSFQAYSEYARGLELFVQMQFAEAAVHWERAAEMNSEFRNALLPAAMAYLNMGAYAKADALVQEVAASRESLSILDQLFLERLEATFQYDYTRALGAMRRSAEINPQGPGAFDAAALAMAVNRPREGVTRLLALDPERGFFRGFLPYGHYLTEAYHLLADYPDELAAARSARERYSLALAPLYWQARALAGLGDVEEVDRLIEAVAAESPRDVSPGWVMRRTAAELLVHGHEHASRLVAQRALDWYSQVPEAQASDPQVRWGIASSLLILGRWEEAESEVLSLHEQDPDRISYRGYLGVIAARLGDLESAREHASWLQQLDRPYLFGIDDYYRAAIAVWTGDNEQAARLLSEAITNGLPIHSFQVDPHSDFILQPLRGYPAFEKLLAPKG